MATSMTASILFFGSITWPSLMTMEYCWADANKEQKVNRIANLNDSLKRKECMGMIYDL
jgi:hypothetical protein